jgi:tRNA-dihydrouridine synthase A
LKREFSRLVIVVNGGITTAQQIDEQLGRVDGVMIGREAYHHPWSMAEWDRRFDGATSDAPPPERDAVEAAMVEYMERESAARAIAWPHIARHMMGLRNGAAGARRWRQVWSDHRLKDEPAREVSRLARSAMQASGAAVEPC